MLFSKSDRDRAISIEGQLSRLIAWHEASAKKGMAELEEIKRIRNETTNSWNEIFDKLLQSQAALEKQSERNHEFVVQVMTSFENRLMEMQSTQTRWIALYEKTLALAMPKILAPPRRGKRKAKSGK